MDLESSSTRFDAAVKALIAHLHKCVANLYVEETNTQNPGDAPVWTEGKKWRAEYDKLMVFVTRTLNTAYTEYERGRSGGLTFEMYQRFGELLRICREWVKEKETVVLATQEEYKRRMIYAPVIAPVIAPGIRQDGEARRDHGSEEVRKLQKQVSDLQFAMSANAPAIRGFHDNKRAYDIDAAYFSKTLMSLIGRMEKVEALVPVVETLVEAIGRMESVEKLVPVVETLVEAAKNKDDHDKIEGLLGRVAALEKPFYRRGWGTKTSVHPESDVSTLLLRMDAFNS